MLPLFFENITKLFSSFFDFFNLFGIWNHIFGILFKKAEYFTKISCNFFHVNIFSERLEIIRDTSIGIFISDSLIFLNDVFLINQRLHVFIFLKIIFNKSPM